MRNIVHGMAVAACAAAIGFSSSPAMADSVEPDAVSPVTNPLFFEDPHIHSEIRPIFAYHRIDDDFITKGGDVRVYAAQLRWAVTDRLAIIATKDGYIEFNPHKTLPHADGWADLGFGVKYALIDDKENDLVVTPGLKLELPTGNRRVFQGNGDGEWNPFVSAAKGYGNWHLTGSFGGRIPNNFDEETAQIHYSGQIDYWVCRWFIPFVAVHGFTVLSDAEVLPLDTEGYDLVNFGSSEASGHTHIILGAGFRSRLHHRFDVGAAYERAVTTPRGLFQDRVTIDAIWRF